MVRPDSIPAKCIVIKGLRALFPAFSIDLAAKCELWGERGTPDGFLADVFDGRVWKEWQYFNGEPFLAALRKYAFMLYVNWFQPFKHSIYSVGALYMVLMNHPRAERFKL